MLLKCVQDFRCPSRENNDEDSAICGGSLVLSEDRIPARLIGQNKEDALEALLNCKECSRSYPIISGVLLLVPDINSYIEQNHHHIYRALVEGGLNAQVPSEEMINFLYRHGGRTANPSQPGAWDQDLPWVLSRYIQAHFGKMSERVSSDNHLWSHFVTSFDMTNEGRLYDILISMYKKRGLAIAVPTGRAVDIGCSVGGMTYRLGNNFEFTYGIDLSFSAILTARRIVQHSPEALRAYRLLLENETWTENIELVIEKRSNVEFVVASATALPFEDEFADCISTINLIDVLPKPEDLFVEIARLLTKKGILLMADPYCWRDTVRDQIEMLSTSSANFIRDNLARHNFNITESSMVPWLLRLNQYRWDVYLCDSICATKMEA